MASSERILAVGKKPKPAVQKTSPIFDWMVRHYEDCKRDWPERNKAWADLAKAFKAEGIMDGRGKPPTAKTVAATWYKVRLKMERTRVRRRPSKLRREIRRAFQRTAQ